MKQKTDSGRTIATCFNKKCKVEIDGTNDGAWLFSQLCVSCYKKKRTAELRRLKGGNPVNNRWSNNAMRIALKRKLKESKTEENASQSKKD